MLAIALESGHERPFILYAGDSPRNIIRAELDRIKKLDPNRGLIQRRLRRQILREANKLGDNLRDNPGISLLDAFAYAALSGRLYPRQDGTDLCFYIPNPTDEVGEVVPVLDDGNTEEPKTPSNTAGINAILIETLGTELTPARLQTDPSTSLALAIYAVHVPRLMDETYANQEEMFLAIDTQIERLIASEVFRWVWNGTVSQDHNGDHIAETVKGLIREIESDK
jgi:hypothetical protein